MKILNFSYQNFRNLEDNSISPYEGVNVIYGENAQGKTNIIECLWLLTGGHSFRAAKDFELIKLNRDSGKSADFLRITVDFFSQQRKQSAVLQIKNGKRVSVINSVEKRNGAALIGKICAVLFSPEHLKLIKDGPAGRRNFIDAALCQMKPSYAKVLTLFNRSLSQRNALLKEINRHPELIDTLDVWNQRLSDFASAILYNRNKYIRQIKTDTANIYHEISRKHEEMDISYMSTVKNCDFTNKNSIGQHYIKELKRLEKTDIKAGFTTCGPHRDDMEILIGGLQARVFASQGQQRSAVLALKLAEAQRLTDSLGESPIILLDDVMSELDENRRDYLLNHLENKQVFITCCLPETVSLMALGKRIRVHAGAVIGE